MFDAFQEHCDYEANARFDAISEAYAATALDPYYEGYCNYVFDAEEAGNQPLSFADWKARLTAPRPRETEAERDASFEACPF